MCMSVVDLYSSSRRLRSFSGNASKVELMVTEVSKIDVWLSSGLFVVRSVWARFVGRVALGDSGACGRLFWLLDIVFGTVMMLVDGFE